MAWMGDTPPILFAAAAAGVLALASAARDACARRRATQQVRGGSVFMHAVCVWRWRPTTAREGAWRLVLCFCGHVWLVQVGWCARGWPPRRGDGHARRAAPTPAGAIWRGRGGSPPARAGGEEDRECVLEEHSRRVGPPRLLLGGAGDERCSCYRRWCLVMCAAAWSQFAMREECNRVWARCREA